MRLAALLAFVVLASCATAPDRYEQEWRAYTRYLDSEIAAGRMTRPQAEYLASRKRNELLSLKARDDASLVDSLGTAAIVNSATNGPNAAPLPPQNVCRFRGNTMICQ